MSISIMEIPKPAQKARKEGAMAGRRNTLIEQLVKAAIENPGFCATVPMALLSKSYQKAASGPVSRIAKKLGVPDGQRVRTAKIQSTDGDLLGAWLVNVPKPEPAEPVFA